MPWIQLMMVPFHWMNLPLFALMQKYKYLDTSPTSMQALPGLE